MTVYCNAEHTDTFGGEANYSWVDRVSFPVPDKMSDRAVIRKAKKLLGLSSCRHTKADYGDGFELRYSKVCVVTFISFDDTARFGVENDD